VPQNALALNLDESDKRQLQQWSSAFGTPQQVALRCRIVLAAGEGEPADEIAARLELKKHSKHAGPKNAGCFSTPTSEWIAAPFVATRFGQPTGGLLNLPQRPTQPAQCYNLLFLFLVQDIAHIDRG
jgi:hypothetical protein